MLKQCTSKCARSITVSLQWYDLLSRPKLAGYDKAYKFGHLLLEDQLHYLPPDVIEEWCISLLLSPGWIVDLRTPLSKDVIATKPTQLMAWWFHIQLHLTTLSRSCSLLTTVVVILSPLTSAPRRPISSNDWALRDASRSTVSLFVMCWPYVDLIRNGRK